ncbi:disease resistance protein RPM1-like [Pistacia vera]|uniref:disease resistance protein RPM1-like n=1 Tax=Pistacia vera TaxID=55513 RepID=UPI0012636BA5|nr:disease resistance protein RPM1-like [Pistacia vera]
MADIAVSAALVLVENVLPFIEGKVKLKKDVRGDVDHVKSMLKNIESYIKDMDRREETMEVLKNQISEVRELAYDMEDVVLEFKYHVSDIYCSNRLSEFAHKVVDGAKRPRELHKISSTIEGIKRKMEIVSGNMRINTNIPHEEGTSHHSGVGDGDHAIHQIHREDEMMGFEEEKKRLHRLIYEDSSCMMKISVVGTGGTGKTFLVKTVCESKKVLAFGKYDCHAWIHVSQTFKIDEVLRSMLKQFRGGRENLSLPSSGEDLRAELTNILERKSYVVVLDDVWREDDYEEIVKALPESRLHRRIIVTTRNLDVAACRKSSDHKIELKGLTSPFDWQLFCKKAFQGSEYPSELKDWSEKILKKCEGLPLAIAAVGSLLAKKRQTPYEWKTLHDSLGSEIAPDSGLAILSRILWPSYKDLSINHKSCFLYFSIFPEEYSIPRGRLIRSWIAEGFIKNTSGKTPEKVAEDYLNELIGRNLVSASAWDFDGRVSSCRVLNLVREFIIQISEKENFVTALSELGASSGEKIRRLSINHSKINLSHLMKGKSSVRTLFVFAWGNSISPSIGKLIHHSRLLRVLDLQGICFEDFPDKIFELTLLRCLSLRETNIEKIPKYIRNLAFLETLDLRQTCVTKLPLEILGLKFLRHLLVYRYNVSNYVTFNSVQGVEVPPSIGNLSALEKLSCVKANSRSGVIEELKKMSQLRKLGIIDLKRKDGKALCQSIATMEHLLTLDVCSASEEEYIHLEYDVVIHPDCVLQRLYLKGRLEKFPGWISSLKSLVRLGLKWSRLKDSPLEALQALPNLLELHMVDCYTGELLEFKAATFRKLKILYLEQFEHLHTVIMEEKAMPELAKLTICKCEQLTMLPLGINHLSQLEELLVFDMNSEFVARLKKNSEDRLMVSHVRDIRSFTLASNHSFSSQNLT